jgi:hypothetical protein
LKEEDEVTRSNPYTFSTAVRRRIAERNGKITGRNVVAWFWLAYMGNDVQKAYGQGELTDADILHMAHNQKLIGTGPWLEEHGRAR